MKRISAIVITAASAVALHALSLEEVGKRMEAIECYSDSVRYEVYLPNLDEPVVYSVGLESLSAPGDTLSPCRYFIGWQLPAPSGVSEGFIAYFDGTHYRLRDQRLQEYHQEWNPEVFAPGGDPVRGVQTQAQFVDLLPQSIGRHFVGMASDSTYVCRTTVKTYDGRPCVVVDGVRRMSGYDAAEFTYYIDEKTYMPLAIEFENNPGQLGEQTVSVHYRGNGACNGLAIDEESVMARRPDEFAKYRESTFSIQSLPGRDVPRIVSRTTTGERYEHERGSAFAAPTLLVFADATIGSSPSLVRDVRDAVDAMPMQVDVVWAFINHRADDVEAVVPSVRPGEHLLVGARGAARECGVGNVTPVLIFASPAGKVTDYIIGYNPDLVSLVIEKASIAAQ